MTEQEASAMEKEAINKAIREATGIDRDDFDSDLNAMHEAEGSVNVADYVRALRDVVGWDGDASEDIEDDWLLLHATAAQRAEAFCRVMWPEKWKD